ncbi:hypothetical protein FOT57_10285 [Serratia ureilytica]|nr:hypothetical protein FOT57_10285 [Serratia ureilytica]
MPTSPPGCIWANPTGRRPTACQAIDKEGKKRGFSPLCGDQPKINKLIFLVFYSVLSANPARV